MKCREASSWIDAALDGDLPGERRVSLERHLDVCPACRREWDALCLAEAALRVPGPVAAPEGMLLEFRRQLASEVAPPARARRWTWPWTVAGIGAGLAAASAAAVFIMAWVPLQTGGTTERPVEMARAPREADGSPGPGALEAGPAPVPPRMETVKPAKGGRTDGTGEPRASAPPTAAFDGARPVPKRPGSLAAGTSDPRRNERAARPVSGPQEPAAPLPPRPPGLVAAAPPPPPEADLRAETVRGGAVPAGEPAPVHLASVSGPQPPELEVSPALLTALQRKVAVRLNATPVREAARELTIAADVPVQVDPEVEELTVSVRNGNVPLWQVLEDVAVQGNLEIYPSENTLVIRPADPAGPGATPLSRARVAAAAPGNPGDGPFRDVPRSHWIYETVHSLQERGLFTGYPDGTFSGRRTLTRYEFAVALQRMLQEVQRLQAGKPVAAREPRKPRGPAGPAGPPGTAASGVAELRRQRTLLKQDVTSLQKLAQEFRAELAMLGADVEQLKRNLQALADRVTRVEAATARMPRVTGGVDIGLRAERGKDGPQPVPAAKAAAGAQAGNAAPERRVWSPEWGSLPEQGFRLPTPEDVPVYYEQMRQQILLRSPAAAPGSPGSSNAPDENAPRRPGERR